MASASLENPAPLKKIHKSTDAEEGIRAAMQHCFLFTGMTLYLQLAYIQSLTTPELSSMATGSALLLQPGLQYRVCQHRPHLVCLADLEEEQKNDVVHVMFKRTVVPGEVLIRWDFWHQLSVHIDHFASLLTLSCSCTMFAPC